MKILYIHQLFSTPSGAVGTRSYEIARRMVNRGHEVTVICGSYANAHTGLTAPFVKSSRKGVVEGINVIEFAIPVGNKMSFLARTGAFLKFALKGLSVVLFSKYDLVYATSTPLTVGINGIAAKIFRRKKFIFEVRDLWPELPKAMGVITNPIILFAMSFLEWCSYRFADACVGLSPGIVAGIKKRAQKNKQVLLAPNAADLEFFGEDVVSSNLTIDGIEKDDFVAIFTGTHGQANGIDNLLDTAAALLKDSDNWSAGKVKLLFVGDGGKKEGLVERVEKEGLSNCIFLPPVPKCELRAYLKRADVGLMALANVEAFYYGTSPNKFFDYLAASLPVVCNYPGWISEMIISHDCGKAVEPEKPQQLAGALIELAENREALVAMKAKARELAAAKFNRDDIAKSVVDFVEGI